MAIAKSVPREEPKNRPIRKFRVGNVQASVWRNTFQGRDGKTIETESVSFSKFYKDAQGQWQTTNSYKKNEVPKLLTAVHHYLAGQVVETDTPPEVEEDNIAS
jgi:hypothetical protein